MPEKDYCKLMSISKKIAELLDRKLKVERTALVIEGLGVNHAHVKLYPLHSLSEGHITTKLGSEKTIGELNKIAEKITK